MSARLFALVASLAASAPGVAVADVAPAPAAPAARTVEVEVVGQADEAHALQASLSELLGRIGLELRLTIVERPQAQVGVSSASAVVVAQVDLRETGSATVLLMRPGSLEGTPRSVPQRDSRELLLEEVALVIYTGVESLTQEPPAAASPLASVPPEVAPATAPVPATPAVSPPLVAPASVATAPARDVAGARDTGAARAAWVVEGAMLVSAQAYAADVLAVGGVELGVRARFGESPWVPGFWLLGAFHFPFRETAPSVELSTSVWSVRLLPAFELGRHGSFRFELGAGGGVDIFVLAPSSSVAGAEASSDRHQVSPVLTALALGSFATGQSSRVVLGASLDWDLAPRRYVVAQGDVSTVLLAPWALRPGVSLGFAFDAIRSERP